MVVPGFSIIVSFLITYASISPYPRAIEREAY